jgi:hypothetical protein
MCWILGTTFADPSPREEEHWLLAVVSNPKLFWDGKPGTQISFLDSMGVSRASEAGGPKLWSHFLWALAAKIKQPCEIPVNPQLLELIDVQVRSYLATHFVFMS